MSDKDLWQGCGEFLGCVDNPSKIGNVPSFDISHSAWTKELPSKPGFYWLRNYLIYGYIEDEPKVTPEAVELGELGVSFAGDDVSYTAEDVHGEWHGPIYPPD